MLTSNFLLSEMLHGRMGKRMQSKRQFIKNSAQSAPHLRIVI